MAVDSCFGFLSSLFLGMIPVFVPTWLEHKKVGLSHIGIITKKTILKLLLKSDLNNKDYMQRM